MTLAIRIAVFWLLALIRAFDVPAQAATQRPNILWITAEDLSANLGCYGDAFARTPHLDAFARQSVRYTRAFATSPTCAPSRACLITGIYATALGNPGLRCQIAIPSEFKGYPAYLREAGYFCSNNSKTDYNLENPQVFVKATWDRCDPKAHWRQRKPGQPFFSIFNLLETHQSRSSTWSWEEFERMAAKRLAPEERADPANAPLPPYYPDTEIARRTMARYYDCVRIMDKEVGRILHELEQDGLAEDTIVFFYSDHGAGLPRHKRVPHDSGMHVPLLVRFPDKYRHLSPVAPGRTVDRLVSFVDFPPTALSLAGTPIPEHMQGAAFLGAAAVAPRNHVYGARDRVDEAYEVSRSVRDDNWLYIRNYLPHLSWNQPEHFSDRSELRREITYLATAGKLNAAQLTYAGPGKPREEFYDTRTDPHQVRNLAAAPAHQTRLAKMRTLQREWVLAMRDIGFLPEQEMAERLDGRTPWEFARNRAHYPLEKILGAAELVGAPGVVKQQVALLKDTDSAVRCWAAVGLRAAGREAASARPALTRALKDKSLVVRIEAASALAALDDTPNPQALKVLTTALTGDQLHAALQAARALELLGEKARPALPTLKTVAAQLKNLPDADKALQIGFSLNSAIAKLDGQAIVNNPQMAEP